MQTPESSGIAAAAEVPLERPTLNSRAPQRADLEEILRIDRQWTGRDRRDFLSERLDRTLRAGAINLARILERDGQIIGFVFGEVMRGEFGHVGVTAWIDTIGIDRRMTRGGAGSALLSDFMTHARAAGSDCVRTLLEPEDEALTEFLEQKGFRLAPVVVVEHSLDGKW